MLSSLPDFCYDLYKQGQLVDLTLTCADGDRLMVHSIVLALRSKVIRELLLHLGDLTRVSAIVHVGDVDVRLLRSLVEFAYTAAFGEEADEQRDRLLFVAKQLGLDAAVAELQSQEMPLKLRKKVDAALVKAVNVSAQFKCKTCDKTFTSARQCKRHSCEVKVEVIDIDPQDVEAKKQTENGLDGEAQVEPSVVEEVATGQGEEEEEKEEEEEEEEPVNTKEEEESTGKRSRTWKRSHNPSLPFKCPHCMFCTSKASYLSDHTRVRHPNAQQTCPHCQLEFPRKEIGRHKKGCEKRFSGQEKEEEVFHCKLCSYTASKARYMSDHTRKVHGAANMPCIHCGQTFLRKEIYLHQSKCTAKPPKIKSKVVYEKDEETLECPVKDCEFVAEDREQKLLHAQTQHKVIVKKKGARKQVSTVCDQCGRTMKSRAALKVHIIAVHSEGKVYCCSMCEYQGKSPLALRSHCQLIHSCNSDGSPYERRFACTVCNFKAMHRCTLKTHMRRHDAKKQFACDKCPYQTYRKDSLLKHKGTMHAASRPVKVCRTCGKSFVSETGFRMHNLRHLGLRPYHCSLCNLPFARLSTFEHHNLRKHPTASSQPPLSCTHCNYTCGTASSLKQHFRSKHGIQDICIVGGRRGPRPGLSSFKNRFKEFNKVDEFIEGNTIEGKLELNLAEKNTSAVAEEMLQGDDHMEMQEASEILAGIGASSSQVEVDGTVEVSSTPTVYEVNGQTIAVYYV